MLKVFKKLDEVCDTLCGKIEKLLNEMKLKPQFPPAGETRICVVSVHLKQ